MGLARRDKRVRGGIGIGGVRGQRGRNRQRRKMVNQWKGRVIGWIGKVNEETNRWLWQAKHAVVKHLVVGNLRETED